MNGTRKAIAVLLAGAALVLLGAGCGGGGGSKALSKSDYVKQLTTIADSLSGSIGKLSSASSPAEAATVLTKARADLRSAATKLQGITPPADVKVVHAQLTKAVGELADELGPVIQKLKGGDLSALASVLSMKGFKDLQAADAALAKAGYKLNLSLGG